jgi:hypothetical protein
MAMSNPTVFVGIPCYQESEKLHHSVATISKRAEFPFRLEVHVAKQSAARNKNALLQKAKESGAKYVCLCDDDVEPQQGWDAALIAPIERLLIDGKIRIGQTAPYLVYPDGALFCTWLNIYFDPNLKEHSLYCPGWSEVDPKLFHTQAVVGALPGTFTIFTSECLAAIGWKFDERYERSQYDDLDQSLSCRDAGYSLLYNGLVTVTHHAAHSSPRSTHENKTKLLDKWGRRSDLTLVIPGTPHDIAHAAAQLKLGRGASAIGTAASSLQLLSKRPLHRLAAAWHVLRRNGIRGVLAHCRRLIDEERAKEAVAKR